MRTIGPIVRRVDNWNTIYCSDSARAESACKQIGRTIGILKTSNTAVPKTSPQFSPHGYNGIPTICWICMPTLTEIDAKNLVIPHGRETDLRPQKWLITVRRSARCRRRERDIADQLSRFFVCHLHLVEDKVTMRMGGFADKSEACG